MNKTRKVKSSFISFATESIESREKSLRPWLNYLLVVAFGTEGARQIHISSNDKGLRKFNNKY